MKTSKSKKNMRTAFHRKNNASYVPPIKGEAEKVLNVKPKTIRKPRAKKSATL